MATLYYVRALKKVVTEQEWRGLGDVIASATKAIGIAPCPKCRQRQESLNKALPFKKIDSLP